MKRNTLINLLLLIAFCVGLGVFFIQNRSDDVVEPSVVSAPVAPDWIRVRADGLSMYPFILDGERPRVYPRDVPVIGDIVYLRCLAERCSFDEDDSYFKFLRRIDSRGCYWFEGRDDTWLGSDGKTYESFDSSAYGYLCPGEFKVLGVVREYHSREGE